ncbi:MAG: protease [Castellaniella sp.]|uniref:S8 family serine peptidase n=1 Tax=Castellaniella sp. TaxID=1955812 RepID=UPI00121DFE6F|nr:S8 family serine peptidase [Castellaniella sp.]TAN28919.1 MAG: protease [Castellaniella sp.]
MSQVKPQASPRTGRYLVLLGQDDLKASIRHLSSLAQITIRQRSSTSADALDDACALVFDQIGVAFIRCTDQERSRIAAAAGGNTILAVEPERTVYAIAHASHQKRVVKPLKRAAPDSPTDTATWGIRAVGAEASKQTGKGIRIAILDTGLDLTHPDFAGRAIESRSFVSGQPVQDGNGHGTHCAGIAAGPAKPKGQPRYGVAGEAELYIGKVLGNEGSGGDGSILEGIDWAISQGCAVVSMSLGSPVQPGEGYSAVYEGVARRALAAGTLIVAAAGNESQRPEFIAPVGHPANCPSIAAIGALAEDLSVAPFSDGGLEGNGGEIDLAAPGVDVLSSWPAPELHHTLSGTSMATPFVAGVAALYAQADSNARAERLLKRLEDGAQKLQAPARDVGAGLVRAPGAA